MDTLKNDEIRQAVKERYGRIAASDTAGCGCGPSCCDVPAGDAAGISQSLGYLASEIAALPEGSNMGLGCGNPKAIAALQVGETVLDLGSGGGIDAFLAAREVGDTGKVIGVDMTSEMISKSRSNAAVGAYRNVEFRLGEIESLPVADATVDVIISNCVINLSPDKPRVFAEAFRVLKPGGRLAISDIVAFAELPDEVKSDLALYTGCVAGASTVSEVESMLAASGFVDVRVSPKDESRSVVREWAPGTDVGEYIVSASIEGVKPLS
jgi:SAM-dependent methyltransferase